MNDVRLTYSPRCFLSVQIKVPCWLQRIRIWVCATGPCGPDLNPRKKKKTATSVTVFANHTRSKNQICVRGGGVRIGRLWVECERSAMPPYWRGYNGVRAGAAGQCSGTAEIASSRARSWNLTPRLLTLPPLPLSLNPSLPLSRLLTSLPHPASLWSEVLALSCSSPSSSSSSHHPSRFLPTNSSSASSGVWWRGYGLIWIFECISPSSSLGRGVVLQSCSCAGVMGPSAQGSLS